MSEGFFDWVYKTEEFRQAKEYISKFGPNETFEDAISAEGFNNPLFRTRDLSKNNVRFYDKIIGNVRRILWNNKTTLSTLRKMAESGVKTFDDIPNIGPERAKFLYELFKPEE